VTDLAATIPLRIWSEITCRNFGDIKSAIASPLFEKEGPGDLLNKAPFFKGANYFWQNPT